MNFKEEYKGRTFYIKQQDNDKTCIYIEGNENYRKISCANNYTEASKKAKAYIKTHHSFFYIESKVLPSSLIKYLKKLYNKGYDICQLKSKAIPDHIYITGSYIPQEIDKEMNKFGYYLNREDDVKDVSSSEYYRYEAIYFENKYR